MDSIIRLKEIILQRFYAHTSNHVFTVAISGIDASGKGFISKLLENKLQNDGLKVANINLDPWQNPLTVRLQEKNGAKNFYERVFRWNDVFEQLIIPLKQSGSIQLTAPLIRTHADEYYSFNFDYSSIDILLIEAIFLFQNRYLPYYDLKIWIDCSFETGMKRAIDRNVERLDKTTLAHDYDTYYYPAQHYHFGKDQPRSCADIIYCNDELSGIVGHMTVNF